MIAIALLKIFRDNRGDFKWFTRDELISRLKNEIEEDILFVYSVLENGSRRENGAPLADSDVIDYAVDYLVEDLIKLDLIVSDESGGKKKGQSRWRISAAWRPRSPDGGSGGGIGGGVGGGGGGGGGGGENNNNGDGLREVLRHPVLFALTDEDFDDLVNEMFE